MKNDITVVRVTKETRDRVKAVGRKGESYNDVIIRLLNVYEEIE